MQRMGMSVLRFAMIVAAVLVALAGAFALTLPWLVSTDGVQASVERELGNFFGTDAQLGGRTEVTILPRPRVILRDVTIDGPGGVDVPIMTTESLEADIGLAGLITGRPRFSNFRLVRPHLRIVQTQGGEIDWVSQTGRAGRLLAWADAASANDTDPDAAPDRQAGADQLGTVVAENGRATIVEPDGTIVEDITEIDATVNWPRLQAPLTVEADAIWRGTAGTVSFSTQAPTAFFLNQPAQTDVAIRSEAAMVEFSGQASVGGPPFAEGELSFSTPSVQNLMTILETEVTPGRALGAVEMSGPVRFAQRRIRFEGLSISVDGNSGNGVLEIGLGEPDAGPSLTGTLDFQSLDIGAFLSAFVDVPQLIGNGQVETSRATEQMTADFRISAATANFGDLSLGMLAATAQVSEDVAIFDIGDAQAYGGHVQARLSLSSGASGDDAEIILSGQEVDTAEIGEAFDLPRALPRGRGNFSVTMNGPAIGSLRSSRELDGMVAIEMTTGVMPGFGVGALLDQERASRYFSLDVEAPAQPFTAARIYGDIAEGLLTLRDTRIVYPDADVVLTGIVSLGTGGLALTATAARGYARPDGGDGEGEARGEPAESAQFFVGGSWDRPFATPVFLP